MSEIRDRAKALYVPPFRFEDGYIWDAKGQMVADDHVDDHGTQPLRVRGWGRIGYLKDAEDLQDEVGKHIAEILSAHWNGDGRQNRPN